MPTLLHSSDGSHTLLAEGYGVTYHSRHGAVTESGHVFVEAGFLKKSDLPKIRLLEVGLGTGLNAFMTWITAEKMGKNIQYTALEPFPISREMADALNYPATLGEPSRKADFMRLHTSPWGQMLALSPHFSFQKYNARLQDTPLPEQGFELIYYDAFAPQAQPEMWEAPIFESLFTALAPGGIMVTYCAQGAFRRSLRQIGFEVEKLPGPPGKREMTRAIKPTC